MITNNKYTLNFNYYIFVCVGHALFSVISTQDSEENDRL